MFKHQLLRKLKIFAFLLLIVGVMLGIRYLNTGNFRDVTHSLTDLQTDDPFAAGSNDGLPIIQGNSWTKAAENERFLLTVDPKDGNIEVTEKSSGIRWRSKPTEEQLERDHSNNLWKNNMQSPILVEYVKNYTETVPTYANAYTPNTEITVYQLENGARAHYHFVERGIEIAIDYYLRDDHLEVVVPNQLITEAEDNWTVNAKGQRVLNNGNNGKIVAYSVLPFFGAVQRDAQANGYLMVPDGSGGLIRFSQHKQHLNSFTGVVYGQDLSYANRFDNTLYAQISEPKVYFPAFGISWNNQAVFSVIHQGEGGAEIIANPAGVQTSFYNAYPRFKYRERYKELTDLTGAGIFQYSEFAVNESRSVKYYFLSGEAADYSGMAAVYRDYLMNEKGLTRRTQTAEGLPLELQILGGTAKEGFLTDGFLPMTTFQEAEDIIQQLQEDGIDHMTVVYTGWAKDGTSVEYPNRFPADRRLGGNTGLSGFVEKARQAGYKVLLEDNHSTAITSRGLSARNDVVRTIHNSPLDVSRNNAGVHILNTTMAKRLFQESMEQYQAWGIDGIQESGLNVLVSDFNPNHPAGRTIMKQTYAEMITSAVETLGSARISGGMAYQLTDGVSVADLASEISYSPIVDEIIPFYQLAIHGLVEYVTIPYNMMDEPAQGFMKAVEYGSNVSFIVTKQPTEWMREASDKLYSSEFSIWKEDIIRLYSKLTAAIGDVSHLFILRHDNLADDVYRTTYENGKEIITNYSDDVYVYNGISVSPMDFAVIEGSD